ncbi:MAG: serine hydrolase [Methyloligellaceae bacterium]
MSFSPSGAAKYAALVVDGNTGKVLYARNADSHRYPASLTKMMTLYMLFAELKKGTIAFDTKLTVTKHAAMQPPSKLGLKPGQKITVMNAIRALVTKSANDIAATVGDNLAGSEAQFAKNMTTVARKMGMKRTTFRNASGLPDSRQKTTARDMITLSRRLFEDFPEYFHIFKTKYFAYKGRKYRNHNRLLFGFRGVEGIKTGYTRASGFNLTTSYRSRNKHVLAVVMGGRTSRKRNAQMRYLLRRYIPKAVAMKKKPKKKKITQPPRVMVKATKPAKKIRVADKAGKPDIPVIRVLKVKPAVVVKTEQPIGESNMVERITEENTENSTGNEKQGSEEIAQNSAQPVEPVVQKAVYRQPENNIKAAGPFHIQVGAFSDHSNAQSRLSTVSTKAGPILRGHPAVALSFDRNDKTIVRARFAAFSKRKAKSTCRLLKRKSINCIVLRAE